MTLMLIDGASPWLGACAIIGLICFGLRTESLAQQRRVKERATATISRFWPLTDLRSVIAVGHMGKTVVVLHRCDNSDATFDLEPDERQTRLFTHAWLKLAERPPVTISEPVLFPDCLKFQLLVRPLRSGLIAIIGSREPVPYSLWTHYGDPDTMRRSVKDALQAEISRKGKIRPPKCVDDDSPLQLLCWHLA
jgi:hypothetical protein